MNCWRTFLYAMIIGLALISYVCKSHASFESPVESIDLNLPLTCLALNIYHESHKGWSRKAGWKEPLEGRLAIALVTLNRAKYKKEKICPVVFMPRQFSWTTDNDWMPKNKRAWRRSVRDARTALNIQDFTNGATHFHTTPTKAWWSKYMIPIGIYGSHRFYREPERRPQ